MESKKNVLYIIFISLAVGFAIGYFSKDSKEIIKTISSKKDEQTIADLQQQLKQKTKIVRLYTNGVVSSETTDIDTEQNTQQQIKIVEKIVYLEKEIIKINEKKYYIEANYGTDKNYGFNTHYAVFAPVHIGIGINSNFTNNTVFRFGIGLNF